MFCLKAKFRSGLFHTCSVLRPTLGTLAAELGKTQAPFLEGVPRLVGEQRWVFSTARSQSCRLQRTQPAQNPARGWGVLEGSLSPRLVTGGRPGWAPGSHRYQIPRCSSTLKDGFTSGHSCGSEDGPGHVTPCPCLKTLAIEGQLLSLGMTRHPQRLPYQSQQSFAFSKADELMSCVWG